jgi:hypothetical protein
MKTTRLMLFGHTCLSVLLLAGPAIAQTDPSQAFEAATGPPKENLPAWPFLYGAYFCIWVLLFAYVGLTWLRNVQLSHKIAGLDARLDRLDAQLEGLEGTTK